MMSILDCGKFSFMTMFEPFLFLAYENGGGAFIVPYLIVLAVLGRPMYYMEMCLGQFSSYGPVKMWEISPIFKGKDP